MKILKLSIMLLLITFAVRAQESQFAKVTTLQELLDVAKKENKMIFIDSYFVGCHPCKQMDDEVFVLPEVKKLMTENFISTKIDFMKEDFGKQLQVKYAVTGFPTFLLLNSDGQLVSRFSGYKEADKFQDLLKEAIAKSKKGEVMKGFSNTLMVKYPAFYPEVFTARKSINVDELTAYLKGKDILAEANALPFLMCKAQNPDLTDYFLKNYYELESLYGKDLGWTKRNIIMTSRLVTTIPTRDDAKFESFLNEVKSLFSKGDWPYAKLDMAEAYYYNQFKDHKAFFRYAASNFNDDENKIRYMGMYLDLPSVDKEEKKLFADWMQLVVKENSSYEVLGSAARIMKEQSEPEKARKYADWAVKKAKLLNKNASYYESF